MNPSWADRAGNGSAVEFVIGDAWNPDITERVSVMDVVYRPGVLYHHPSPCDLLVALRRMCGGTLILRTSAIPDTSGIPNATAYWPGLPA